MVSLEIATLQLSIPTALPASVLNTVVNAELYLRRLDTYLGRSAVSIVGWLIVGVLPLVAFDAGGGQSAVEVIRYVVFRGLDRDAWYAISAASMFSCALSASAVLIGLVLHTTGFICRDRSLVLWSTAITLPSLLVLVIMAEPVAAVSVLGTVALPHVGWWLTLSYITFTLVATRGWTPKLDSQAGPAGLC